MGNCCLPIRFHRTPSAANPKNVTLLLLGLDNSGKTTIVKRLAGEPIDSVVPTVGFSVILLRQKGCHVSIYDLGGGPQIRDIWPRYYADAHGIIFVTDAQDVERIEECRQVLESVLQSDQISGKPVLLLANKQDVEGALDEIDIVDRLNLEKLVNEQKCPTLVELCSALDFSKKIDIGIENGYKWLIRSIIRDYPSLNNRVLEDLTKQETENKVQAIQKLRDDDNNGIINCLPGNNTFIPSAKIPDQKGHLNGYIGTERKNRPGIKTIAVIPGLIDDSIQQSNRIATQMRYFPREQDAFMARSSSVSSALSHSTEFFLFDKFKSDLELLNEVPNQCLKNFLVRPKSSGARLYGARPAEKKRTHKRKPLIKGNKTRPFTDISNGPNGQNAEEFTLGISGDMRNLRKLPNKVSLENVNPFLLSSGVSKQKAESFEMKAVGGSKSVPNSRRNSESVARRRKYSMEVGKMVGPERAPKIFPTANEILVDVTKLKVPSPTQMEPTKPSKKELLRKKHCIIHERITRKQYNKRGAGAEERDFIH